MSANLEALRGVNMISDAFTCEKGHDCSRCHGCGMVCQAHPHRPRTGLTKDSCTCGAPGMSCRDARRSPISIIVRVGRTLRSVTCTVSDACVT